MLKRNLIANYLGQAWVALMGLAFIPVYIKYLGMEAWGLVAFMSTLQAWLLLLDAGLTPAVSREMARYTAGHHDVQSVRNLLRTAEVFFTALAVLIATVFSLASPWIASHWLTKNQLSEEETAWALVVMGIVLAGRLVEQSYRGILRGLQHQVWLNSIDAVMATFRWAGAAVIASAYPFIVPFFLWQALVSSLSLLILVRETSRVLPATAAPARLDLRWIRSIRSFAGGMFMITALTLALGQIDKLLLSKLLPLDQYGAYMLAAALAAGISFLVMPVSLAVGPYFAKLVALGNEQAVRVVFHKASQWVGMIVVPIGLTIAFFARDMIWVWTGNGSLADRAAPILVPLALGTTLNAFMHIPYQVQLAYGWTRLAVMANAIAVAILFPAILIGVPKYGAIAAAWIWCILNIGYLLWVPHFFHRRILKEEKWFWYINGVIKPTAVSVLIIGLSKILVGGQLNSRQMAVWTMVLCAVMCVFAAMIVAPNLRVAVAYRWKTKRVSARK